MACGPAAAQTDATAKEYTTNKHTSIKLEYSTPADVFVPGNMVSPRIVGHTHATTGGDGDLDGVPAQLAHLLQVQSLVRRLVVATLDGQRRGVHAHLRNGTATGSVIFFIFNFLGCQGHVIRKVNFKVIL